MSLQVTSRREILEAFFALVKLLRKPGIFVVHSTEVEPELADRIEPLLAHGARERVSCEMNCEVVAKIGFAYKRTSTLIAHEGFLFRV